MAGVARGTDDAPTLARAMADSLHTYWAQAEGYQRFLYRVGALLILSGLFHVVVFAVDGGSWAGPVSWRKPIVFGLSVGITAVSIAWFMTFLPLSRRAGWALAGTLAATGALEVFLIDMQRWRGVASHFNDDTAFDEFVFISMGILIGFVAAVIVVVTVRSLITLRAPPSLAWAIRLGLLLMVASQGLGGQIIDNGLDAVDVAGAATFGESGALKVPHAVTLHAAQVLPAVAWLLLFSHWSERRQTQIVLLVAAGYGGLVAMAMVQTYSGLPPLDLRVASLVLLSASAALIATAVASTLTALYQRGTAELAS